MTQVKDLLNSCVDTKSGVGAEEGADSLTVTGRSGTVIERAEDGTEIKSLGETSDWETDFNSTGVGRLEGFPLQDAYYQAKNYPLSEQNWMYWIQKIQILFFSEVPL